MFRQTVIAAMLIQAALLCAPPRLRAAEPPLAENESRIFITNADGSQVKRLADLPEFVSQGSPAWSSDGRLIAFDGWKAGETNTASRIILVNADGTNPRVLIDGAMPSFSPDGRQIVFSRYSNYGVWLMSTEGPEKGLRLLDAAGWSGDWSPDGRKIAYAVYTGRAGNMAIYDVATGERTLLFEAGSEPYSSLYWNFAWSPDSKQIVCKAVTVTGKPEVVIVDARGAKLGLITRLSQAVNENFAWSPDGTQILFAMASPERERRNQLYILDPRTRSAPRLLPGQDESLSNTGVCFSHDGKRLAMASRRNATAGRARPPLAGERELLRAAEQVAREARALAPPERYERLAAWVLPSPGHPSFRLDGYFTPANPAPIAAPSETSVHDGFGPRRAHVGGWLAAPALDLVATAQEIGKLDELRVRVEGAPIAAPSDRRQRLALLALIHAQLGQPVKATAAITQLTALSRTVPATMPANLLFPEMVMTWGLMSRPVQRVPASRALDAVQAQLRLGTPTGEIEHHFNSLRVMCTLLGNRAGDARSFGGDPGLAFWQLVTRGTAASRGEGRTRASWRFLPGDYRLHHDNGHAEDCMYFAAPLRGDFAFECEMHTAGTRIGYGGQLVGLRSGKADTFELVSSLRTLIMPDAIEPLERLGTTCRFRLESAGGQVSYRVDGREIHRHTLEADHDAWLFIRQEGYRNGSVWNVQLTGTPEVPASLKLSQSANLDGWLADYYGETVGADAADHWQRRGDEIYGRTADAPSASAQASVAGRQESVLQYHRPMLESGVLEYEFFYEPGKTLAHPALDRLTFLLHPDGVKLHWLTDAEHERTGLSPNNLFDEPANRRGPAELPLLPGDWNRAKISLAGDAITLALNDIDIYRRTLEPTNQRFFGLFHYADQTDVRVRHITWRGAWPSQLPPPTLLFARQVDAGAVLAGE